MHGDAGGGAKDRIEAAARGAPRLRRRPAWRRTLFPYLLVAPAVVYLLSITLYPGAFAL